MTYKDKVNAYLDGTMTEQEEKEFMQDCCNDIALRNQLFFTAVLRSSH